MKALKLLLAFCLLLGSQATFSALPPKPAPFKAPIVAPIDPNGPIFLSLSVVADSLSVVVEAMPHVTIAAMSTFESMRLKLYRIDAGLRGGTDLHFDYFIKAPVYSYRSKLLYNRAYHWSLPIKAWPHMGIKRA